MHRLVVNGATLELEGLPLIKVRPDGTVTVGIARDPAPTAARPVGADATGAVTLEVSAAEAPKPAPFPVEALPAPLAEVMKPAAPAPGLPFTAAGLPALTWRSGDLTPVLRGVWDVLRAARRPLTAARVAGEIGLTEKDAADRTRHLLNRLVAARYAVRLTAPGHVATYAVAGAEVADLFERPTSGRRGGKKPPAATYDPQGYPRRVFQHADSAATHADMLKLVWDALKAHAWVSFRDVCGTIGFDPRDNADFGNAREVSIILTTLVRRGYAVARGARGACVYATAENAARAAERTKN